MQIIGDIDSFSQFVASTRNILTHRPQEMDEERIRRLYDAYYKLMLLFINIDLWKL